jgi:hypothetical protein
MKLIPKPIVDAQILAHCIGIDPSCLFYQLSALGIISDCMLRVSMEGLINISPSKSLKRGVMNGISGASKHLQPFLILDVLIMPLPVSSATRCNTTAASYC